MPGKPKTNLSIFSQSGNYYELYFLLSMMVIFHHLGRYECQKWIFGNLSDIVIMISYTIVIHYTFVSIPNYPTSSFAPYQEANVYLFLPSTNIICLLFFFPLLSPYSTTLFPSYINMDKNIQRKILGTDWGKMKIFWACKWCRQIKKWVTRLSHIQTQYKRG